MTRRICFAASGSFHSLFKETLRYPPDGYELVTYGSTEDRPQAGTRRRSGVGIIESVGLLPYVRTLWWQYRWHTGDSLHKVPGNTDLIYSAHHVILEKKPWVVAIEHVGDLCPVMYDIKHLSIYRRFIEKILSSRHCKRIMPYLEIGKTTLLKNLNCGNFLGKIEVVHLGVRPKSFVKEHRKKKLSLLFLGTANVSNIAGSFEVRGGKEVLEAFTVLSKNYDDLELIIRAHVPNDVRSSYSKVLNNKNVKVVDEVLPFEQFEHIMKSADALLFPGYITPALTILDAMSYELPVIATDIEGIPEMVEDKRTGFLIHREENTPYTSMRAGKSPPNLNERASHNVDTKVVDELIEKTSVLIEDETLRQKMGREGRRETEQGEFSLKRRNEKLRRIFDEAIEN